MLDMPSHKRVRSIACLQGIESGPILVQHHREAKNGHLYAAMGSGLPADPVFFDPPLHCAAVPLGILRSSFEWHDLVGQH